MNKVLMCLDYNGTIDNLISKCADYESGGKFPTFFRGILSMSVATKSTVSLAIISSAQVDEIKEEIRIINYYAGMYCKLALGDSGNLINYIVGDKSKQVYNCNDCSVQQITTEAQTKKEGVETILGLPSEQGTNLLITGGDTKEDVCMIDAETGGIPNVFISPKANKDVIDLQTDTPIIRDSKNNNSEGIGRCLISLSKSLEEYNLTEAFSQPQAIESESTENGSTESLVETSQISEIIINEQNINPQQVTKLEPTPEDITEIPIN